MNRGYCTKCKKMRKGTICFLCGKTLKIKKVWKAYGNHKKKDHEKEIKLVISKKFDKHTHKVKKKREKRKFRKKKKLSKKK